MNAFMPNIRRIAFGIAIMSVIIGTIYCVGVRFYRQKSLDANLLAASGSRDIKSIRLFLELGANVDARYHYNDFHSPYVLATTDEQRGAVSQEGETPLCLAITASDLESVQALLDAGADVNAVDEKGWTPIFLSAVKHSRIDPAETTKDNIAIRQLLIDRGANVNKRLKDGWTPLHAALTNNGADAVEQLRRAGARDEVPRGKK